MFSPVGSLETTRLNAFRDYIIVQKIEPMKVLDCGRDSAYAEEFKKISDLADNYRRELEKNNQLDAYERQLRFWDQLLRVEILEIERRRQQAQPQPEK